MSTNEHSFPPGVYTVPTQVIEATDPMPPGAQTITRLPSGARVVALLQQAAPTDPPRYARLVVGRPKPRSLVVTHPAHCPTCDLPGGHDAGSLVSL